MTIHDLQQFIIFIDQKIQEELGHDSSKDNAILLAMLKIVEETGELSEAILSNLGKQRSSKPIHNKKEIAYELADLILSTYMLAYKMDINLEDTLKDKLDIITKRYS